MEVLQGLLQSEDSTSENEKFNCINQGETIRRTYKQTPINRTM